METDTLDAAAGDASNHGGAIVKQEVVDKDVSLEVKKEPQLDNAGEETQGRPTRKRKLNSMAEASDPSDESADENFSKPKSKKRGQGGSASASRSRGRSKKSTGDVPTNLADPSRNPRIVLKNIASEGQDDLQAAVTTEKLKVNLESPKAGGRAKKEKGGRGSTPKTPAKPAGKGKNKALKQEKGVEEAAEEDNGDMDYEEELDDDDDEDFVPKKGKGGRGAKQTPRGRGRGRGRVSKVKTEVQEEEEPEEEADEETAAADTAAAESAETNPNAIKTGQYLIEKFDMRRLENYPIWRMEGPNMLRKFEMIVQDGVVRHKSLYAYASWAQSMVDLYEKIQVRQISSQDGETIVEIHSEFLPKPPELSSLESKHADDELLPVYNIYIEAMLRQAVDSGFLKKIKMENDPHYVGAIQHIDAVIQGRIAYIEGEVSMKDEFKTRVRNCPNMKSIRRQNWSQTDQATTNKSTEKGVRSVLMFGYGYDPFVLDEDKSKGVEVAQEVVIGSTMEQYLVSYHGLIHFKYALLRRCQDKVKLTNALEPGDDLNVFDKCLNDRNWILQTFDHLKNLLNNENLS